MLDLINSWNSSAQLQHDVWDKPYLQKKKKLTRESLDFPEVFFSTLVVVMAAVVLAWSSNKSGLSPNWARSLLWTKKSDKQEYLLWF